jgi:cell division protein FtsN
MTISDIPDTSATPPAAVAPSRTAAAVDPLAPGAELPPPAPAVPEEPAIAAPETPDPAIAAATAKAERDRIARELAAKKAEAARAAEIKRQQIAAAQPPAAPVSPAEPTPAPSAIIADPADEAFSPSGAPDAITAAPLPSPPRSSASGSPTLLTPPTMDLPPPSSRPSAPTIAAVQPTPATPTASAVIPDPEEVAPQPSAGSGAFVVQIGAFNSAEEAAASWKRVSASRGAALAGATPEIRQVEVRGSTKYRLRATGYADRAGAARACDRLKAGSIDCFVAPR